MRGIVKSYPGVKALDGIDFDVRRGEVHALVGENGAGKSTLMKVLSGAVRADAGAIEIDGRPVTVASPAQAEALGIAIIYQEFNLVPSLDVAANIMLGREPHRGPQIAARALDASAAAALARLGVQLPLRAQIRTLSVAAQQMVEIAKALSVDARILVMDEPSASLTPNEVDKLFAIIRTLRAQDVGIVYISHRLDEVFAIADRVTVMRDGRKIDTRPVSALTPGEVVRLMVGRTLDAHFPQLPALAAPAASPRLSVRGLTRAGYIEDVTLDVHGGEIVGLAGLVGAGRTSLLRAICAVDRADAGEVLIDGVPLHARSPREAIAAGLAFVTEDRKGQGLVLGMAVRENVTLPHLADFARFERIDRREEAGAVDRQVIELRIRTPSIEQLVRNLSGGNQQKVVLAKWLLHSAKVICFDEPTRGIDVGAKAEIYELMVALARSGVAILMSSSELPEVLGMSMRVAVMRQGRIAAILPRALATQEAVIRAATGTAAA